MTGGDRMVIPPELAHVLQGPCPPPPPCPAILLLWVKVTGQAEQWLCAGWGVWGGFSPRTSGNRARMAVCKWGLT